LTLRSYVALTIKYTFAGYFPPLFETMVDPYFDSLKNADAVEPRFKLAWNELDPAGAPLDTSQLQSTSQFWFWLL
jgi:hypothetical protein